LKKIWEWWKAGFIALLPIVLLYWFISWIVSWFIASGSAFTVTDTQTLNILLFVVLLGVAPLIVRLLLSFSFIRAFGFALTAWIPLIGPLFKFFFDTGDSAKTRVDSFQEVEFYAGPGIKLFGIVVNEMIEHDYSQHGDPLVPWLMVIIPTTPGAITGPIFKVKKSSAIYTGRTGKDTAITAASFGLIYDEVKPAQRAKTPR